MLASPIAQEAPVTAPAASPVSCAGRYVAAFDDIRAKSCVTYPGKLDLIVTQTATGYTVRNRLGGSSGRLDKLWQVDPTSCELTAHYEAGQRDGGLVILHAQLAAQGKARLQQRETASSEVTECMFVAPTVVRTPITPQDVTFDVAKAQADVLAEWQDWRKIKCGAPAVFVDWVDHHRGPYRLRIDVSEAGFLTKFTVNDKPFNLNVPALSCGLRLRVDNASDQPQSFEVVIP
jgi:hypothetical protein